MLLWDRKLNDYVAIGIWDLYFVYIVHESEKTRMGYFIMGIIKLICVHV